MSEPWLHPQERAGDAQTSPVALRIGWYLWTHELIEVSGKDAAVFLDRIFPKNIGNLAIGRERYTTMLDENACIIDDVVVLRMDEQKFWVSTLFTNTTIPWFDAHKENLNVSWVNITSQWEMYAVQGSKSLEMVNSLVKNSVDDQKFFQVKENVIEANCNLLLQFAII